MRGVRTRVGATPAVKAGQKPHLATVQHDPPLNDRVASSSPYPSERMGPMVSRRWRVQKARCQTCIDLAARAGDCQPGNGANGQPVWVVYRDGGEFGCRPTFTEAVKYAHRKAEALG